MLVEVVIFLPASFSKKTSSTYSYETNLSQNIENFLFLSIIRSISFVSKQRRFSVVILCILQKDKKQIFVPSFKLLYYIKRLDQQADSVKETYLYIYLLLF